MTVKLFLKNHWKKILLILLILYILIAIYSAIMGSQMTTESNIQHY